MYRFVQTCGFWGSCVISRIKTSTGWNVQNPPSREIAWVVVEGM